MKRLDYSNFGRFCHSAYHGLSDIKCTDYLLGKHCRYMSYDQMVAFYHRFKNAAQYICDLDSFLFHLKWFDHSSNADLLCEALLNDVMGCDRMIKKECFDELYARYRTEISELLIELSEE